MKLFTIGFTHKSAEEFFTLLNRPDLKRIIDVRLSNSSQLAGFTKKEDLKYFLKALLGKDYLHKVEFAPTEEIFTDYKKKGGSWEALEENFCKLLDSRNAAEVLPRNLIDGSCLLCSEPTPEKCHRRLVAEYLRNKLPGIQLIHL